MALSSWGRGAHAAPSGVTTSFRPPRFRNVIRTCTVIVCACTETFRSSAHVAYSAAIVISGGLTS